MMDNQHLRGIILKLENRLSDDDRKRLHFFLGNNVPRRIRDDPSLGGTLSLMESLFDQDKINEQDFTFLINAFDEIQCMDAVKLLRGKFLFRINLPLFSCQSRPYETDAIKYIKSIDTEFSIYNAAHYRTIC
jgi:hypothetical protein